MSVMKKIISNSKNHLIILSLMLSSSSVFAEGIDLSGLTGGAAGIATAVVAGVIAVAAALVAPRLALKAVAMIKGAISSS